MRKGSVRELSKNSCVIYCRVSTREQVDTMSLSSQERYCREFAQKNDMPIEKVFVEEGKSARTAKRPQLQEMSQFCFENKDKIKAVVMYRLDRLMRDNYEYYSMKSTLKSLGIRLFYATQSMINNTSEGELMEGLLSSTSQYESSIIGRRAKDGMTEARRHGRLTNAPPIGYKWQRTNLESERGEVVADPVRAPLVTEAFMQYDAGVLTMAQIVRHIRELGYTSPRRAKTFAQQNLCRMLRNRTYAGFVFVNEDEGWVRGIHPPLIDEATFDRVQRRLEEQQNPDRPRTVLNPEFPLRAFIRCPKCGRHLTASFSRGKCGGRYPYYRCLGKGCGLGSIRKDRIEGEFLGLLESVVPSREGLRRIRESLMLVHRERQKNVKSTLAFIEKEIVELESRVKTLHEAFLFERRIDKDLYDQMLPELQEKVTEKKRIRDGMQEERVQFEELLDFAFEVLSNSSVMWANSNLDGRLALQQAIFPGGLTYDAEKGFGTPGMSRHFDALSFFKEPQLTVAVPRGIEPRFDG